MPIYEYVCEKCGEKLELIQKVGDEAPEACPKCKTKGEMKKAVTSSAFHLKGGGWYKDLYSSTKPGESSSKTNGQKSVKVDKKADK